ncbi:hypothetical protein L596_025612 [Steinernema carpocapsae]|uniref:Uncharacterized protein n=1 Tax=Steinernema carpocapsae TaxID=34508 RepID=A0A4U5M889_STECR|nr:hypothetical protein L596_025612 [Steinernema carpocapsae]
MSSFVPSCVRTFASTFTLAPFYDVAFCNGSYSSFDCFLCRLTAGMTAVDRSSISGPESGRNSDRFACSERTPD